MTDEREPVDEVEEEFPYPIELTKSIEESLATSNIDKLTNSVLSLTYAITTPGDLSTPSAVITQNWAAQKLVETLTDRRLRDLPKSFPAFLHVQLDWAEFPERVRTIVFDAMKDVLPLFKDNLAIDVFVEMLAEKSPSAEGLDYLEYLFGHERLRYLVLQNLMELWGACKDEDIKSHKRVAQLLLRASQPHPKESPLNSEVQQFAADLIARSRQRGDWPLDEWSIRPAASPDSPACS